MSDDDALKAWGRSPGARGGDSAPRLLPGLGIVAKWEREAPAGAKPSRPPRPASDRRRGFASAPPLAPGLGLATLPPSPSKPDHLLIDPPIPFGVSAQREGQSPLPATTTDGKLVLCETTHDVDDERGADDPTSLCETTRERPARLLKMGAVIDDGSWRLDEACLKTIDHHWLTKGRADAGPGARKRRAKRIRAACDKLLAESTPGTVVDLPQRLERYGHGGRHARYMAAYLDGLSLAPKRVEKLRQCATFLHFREYTNHDRAVRLVGGYFCNQWKLCPTCAIKRGGRMLSVLTGKVMELIEANPRLRAYLVTITTKDGPNCRERFDHLAENHRAYMRQRSDANKWVCVKDADGNRIRDAAGQFVKVRKAKPVEANLADAICWSFEGGMGSGSGEWHWHAHAIWLCEERPWETRLSAEWSKRTGDSMVVDVKEMRFSERRANGWKVDVAEVAADVVEVCKYTLKPSQMAVARSWECQKATAKRHFSGCIGALRFSEAESEALKLKHDAKLDGPYLEIFKAYRAGRYHDVGQGGIDNRGYVLAAGREINREMRARDLAARFVELARSADAPSLIYTRVILGGSATPPDPGPPAIPLLTRGLRIKSRPDAVEDEFLECDSPIARGDMRESLAVKQRVEKRLEARQRRNDRRALRAAARAAAAAPVVDQVEVAPC